MRNKQKFISYTILFFFLVVPWFEGGKEASFLFLTEGSVLLLFLLYLNGRDSLPKTSVLFPLLLLLVWIALSCIFALSLHKGLIGLIRVVILALLYFLLVEYAPDLRDKLFIVIVLTAAILGLWGISERLAGRTPLAAFTNSNHLASYLCVASVIVMGRLFQGKDMKNTIVLSLMFVLLSTALFLTRSRGGILAFLLLVFFFSWWRFGIPGIAVLSIVLLGGFVLIPNNLLSVFLKLEGDPHAWQRIKIWQASFKVIFQKPVFGAGLGSFEQAFYPFNFPFSSTVARYGHVTRFAHSELLQLAAEAGLPALVAFLWILARFFKRGLFMLRGKSEFFIASGGLLVIITQAIFDFNLHLPAIALPFIFFGSLLSREEARFPLSGWQRMSLNVLLIGALLLITGNYVGNVFHQNGKYQTALLFDPLNPVHSEKLGDRFYKNKNDLCAGLAYQAMIWLSPSDPYLQEKMGDFQYVQGEEINALSHYQKAVHQHPFNVFLRMKVARYHMNRGHYLRAQEVLQKIIRLEPFFLGAHYLSGFCYFMVGNQKKAEGKKEVLKYLSTHHPPARTEYERALLYIPEGRE